MGERVGGRAGPPITSLCGPVQGYHVLPSPLVRMFLDAWFYFFLATWLVFPAYLANAVMVPVARRFGSGRFHPLDGGRFLGGSRLLGDGKTVEGALAGVAIGTLGGLVQWLVSPVALYLSVEWQAFYRPVLVAPGLARAVLGDAVPAMARAFLYPAGAVAGDILGSFVKRRLGISRGEPCPVLDQLDFLAGVILVSLPFNFIGASLVHQDPVLVSIIIILTPAIHKTVNMLAHRLGLKDTPS